jgi:hypothetical protein
MFVSSSADGAKGKLIQELYAHALRQDVFLVVELLRVADNMPHKKQIATSLQAGDVVSARVKVDGEECE